MNYSDLVGSKVGQFELLEVIGIGGMGAVFRARQSRLERDVAVKVLPSELGIDQAYIDRFVREAEIVATLEHSHIIPIYGFDTHNGLIYVAMRLLTGGSLMDRLTPRDGSEPKLPSLSEAAQMLRQLSSALDYAHTKGIIHRDIKPGNIMFDQHGATFLVDFGIAKLVDATQALTVAGTTMGTPIFMAPEQWRTEAVTAQTDQYAMGVLLYFALVGSPPFQANTPYMLMQLHLDAPVPPIFRQRANVPVDVASVIEQAMAKRQTDRFPSMKAFADAFDKAIQDSPGEPTVFFRPHGVFADTNKEPQGVADQPRVTVPRKYVPQPTTPSSGIRVPEEDTARRQQPQSTIETYQGNTPLPARRRASTVWYKSPITWLLTVFFAIFGVVAALILTSDSNRSSLTTENQTQTVAALSGETPTVTPMASPDITEEETESITVEVTEEIIDEQRANDEPSTTQRGNGETFPTTTLMPTFTTTASYTPTTEPFSLSARINGDQTNVRAGPNVNFSIVDTLQQGQRVDLYTVAGDWGYIGFNDRYAWVFVELLDISGNIERLPEPDEIHAVQCELPQAGDRYNSEWTAIFWLMGCPIDETVIETPAAVMFYGRGTVVERADTNEVIVVLDNASWTVLTSNSNRVEQLIGNGTPTSTERVTLYIRRYEHGLIYDLDDETDTRILLDRDRLD